MISDWFIIDTRTVTHLTQCDKLKPIETVDSLECFGPPTSKADKLGNYHYFDAIVHAFAHTNNPLSSHRRDMICRQRWAVLVLLEFINKNQNNIWQLTFEDTHLTHGRRLAQNEWRQTANMMKTTLNLKQTRVPLIFWSLVDFCERENVVFCFEEWKSAFAHLSNEMKCRIWWKRTELMLNSLKDPWR